jgi:hypothetical protein
MNSCILLDHHDFHLDKKGVRFLYFFAKGMPFFSGADRVASRGFPLGTSPVLIYFLEMGAILTITKREGVLWQI